MSWLTAAQTKPSKTILPKKKSSGPLTYDQLFNPSAITSDLALPGYRDHLNDIFTTRSDGQSTAVLKSLFRFDPDVSATVNAYLTLANTEPWWLVKDSSGAIYRDGHKALEELLLQLFGRFDYTTLNFEYRPSLRLFSEQLRYMVLRTGALGVELLLDKSGAPSGLAQLDMTTVRWREPQNRQFVPYQRPKNVGTEVLIDSPLFTISYFRQDPTDMYPYSPFVSAINTIAARTQVIQDLYRIMQLTGYPRITVKLLEERYRKNMPANIKGDLVKEREWLTSRLNEVASVVSNLRADQAFVAYDSAELGMMNEDNPAVGVDISKVIEVLNGQNQAAIKTMATIIGRGTSGVNTASVEARVFAMNADEINGPISDIMSYLLTLALRLKGFDAVVEWHFAKAELRSDLELETNKQILQTRWLQMLSLGLVSDDEFHLEMFNHIRPDAIPKLSGTMFSTSGAKVATTASGDPVGTSPDSTTRSQAVDQNPSKSNSAGSV